MRKIGLFGVTANPPHQGHFKVVQEALDFCDEVWVTPVYIHPFGKSFIDYARRLDMLKMLFSDMKNVKIIELDKLFCEKTKETPYSYYLLKFMKEFSEDEINPVLIIGQDNYDTNVWQKFTFHDNIEKEYGLIVVQDFGVHSTQIRDYCKEGLWDKVKQECNLEIAQFLKDNLIYSGDTGK